MEYDNEKDQQEVGSFVRATSSYKILKTGGKEREAG